MERWYKKVEEAPSEETYGDLYTERWYEKVEEAPSEEIYITVWIVAGEAPNNYMKEDEEEELKWKHIVTALCTNN